MDSVDIVRDFYDNGVEEEWLRMERHPIEFELTKRYLKRHIKPGDKVLDLGGGPGRYSLFLAEYGCDVTLADLSQGNVSFAAAKAEERSLPLRAVQADARNPIAVAGERFDHVLLMGPLYHLTEEADREQAVRQCITLLKPGGTLYCAFISSYAGLIYYMKEAPQLILEPECQRDFDQFRDDTPFAGQAFTHAYFALRREIEPFMARFPLEKLHFLAVEGMLAPNELTIMEQPVQVLNAWIDLAEQVCEREDLLSYAEHFLYVGRKLS